MTDIIDEIADRLAKIASAPTANDRAERRRALALLLIERRMVLDLAELLLMPPDSNANIELLRQLYAAREENARLARELKPAVENFVRSMSNKSD